jgi:SAM-dependent methyltransferase
LRSDALSDDEKILLGRVSLSVHPEDGMYVRSAAQHYLRVGLSAVRVIDEAMRTTTGGREVRTVLDWPCGYGRVLRFLRAWFPAAEIVAAEIDTAALDFVRRAFAARPVRSDTDLKRLSLSDRFDLIWCGSLLTHLPEEATADLLRFFHDHLAPHGLCVVTTHGRLSADWLRSKTQTYGLTERAQQSVLTQFQAKGYGHAAYGGQRVYGVSLVSRERMLALAAAAGSWNEAWYAEHGWDHHQDVYCFTLGTPGEAAPSTTRIA